MERRWVYVAIFLIALVVAGTYFFLFPKRCGYVNFAWGEPVRRECSCLGVEVDTSCRMPDGGPCPDAGGSSVCRGVVLERMCYDYDYEAQGWVPASC